MLLTFHVVVDEICEEAFGVERAYDCLMDMFPRPLHARVRVVGAAYLVDLVVFKEVY